MIAEIECRQPELDSLFIQYGIEPIVAPPAPLNDSSDLTQADQVLMGKISASRQGAKFKKLDSGDYSDYPSQSEADLACLCILAFWCSKDAEQMDRIFRHSGLYREKWDEKRGEFTYGQMTIQKAIAQTDKVFGESDSQAPGKKETRGNFRLIQACKIKLRNQQWLIPGLLELDSLALLFGDPGVGKTLWVVALVLSVVTGAPFYGREVKLGPVILIVGEGFNGLVRRLKAWSIYFKVNYENAPLFISEMPAALTDAEMLAQVQDAIDLVSAEHGAPVLIVIDTLARNFGPGDENSTQDMSKFIQSVDALRTNTNATILIVHHSGHGDKSRARGAMALKGALDAEFRLDKDADGVIRMEATKMKDAKYPEPAAYRIQPVPLLLAEEDGTTIFSAVMIPTDYAPPPQKGKAGRGLRQIQALEILKALEAEKHNACTERGGDPATVRISVDDWKAAMKNGGISQQRIFDVIKTLAGQKLITDEGGFVSSL